MIVIFALVVSYALIVLGALVIHPGFGLLTLGCLIMLNLYKMTS